MGTKILRDEFGELSIEKLSNDLKRITIKPSKRIYCPDSEIVTKYPMDLIKKIFDLKSSCWVIDEIKRDESPDYVYKALNFGLFSFIKEANFENKVLLDFGCGAGASSVILGRKINNLEIIGIELDKKLLEIAEMRKKYYGLKKNVSFLKSEDPESIPIKNKVDFVLLSAVYEHLLPTERKKILKMCWQLLKKDGVIFINQTPNRWVIYENHTTNLFLINYLPDKLCHWVAKNFSKRNLKKFSWNQLLRMGIRGGTENEIKKIISKLNIHDNFEVLKPNNLGIKNKVDLWYRSTSTFSKKSKLLKTFIWYIIKYVPFLEKILLPGVVMAISKK